MESTEIRQIICHTSFTFSNGKIVTKSNNFIFEKGKTYLVIVEKEDTIWIKYTLDKTYGPGARFCLNKANGFPNYRKYFYDIKQSERHLKLNKLC